MKKAVFMMVFLLSVLQVIWINVSPYLELSPTMRTIQYRLWSIHTPWLFFTSKVLQKNQPILIQSECLLKTCQQPGDFRFKALMIQNAIEAQQKVSLIEEKLCQLTFEKKFIYRQNKEEKVVECR